MFADRPPSAYVAETPQRTSINTGVYVSVEAFDQLAQLGRLSRVGSLPKAPNETNYGTGFDAIHVSGRPLDAEQSARATLNAVAQPSGREGAAGPGGAETAFDTWHAMLAENLQTTVSASRVATSSANPFLERLRQWLRGGARARATGIWPDVDESLNEWQAEIARKFFAHMEKARLASLLVRPQEAAPEERTAKRHATLEGLRTLPEDWDGEGAPTPSAKAIDRASETLALAEALGLQVTEVDADVLGGVAVWLSGNRAGVTAWVSLMNNDSDTLVLSDNGKISHHPWDERSKATVAAFLGSGDDRSAM